MKKVWKFIVKKRIYIVILFFVAVLVLCGLALNAYMYPEDQNANYGARLLGIESYPIDNEKKDSVVSKIKENEKNTDASIRVQGKIIEINITTTTAEQSIDAMKSLGNELVAMFDENQRGFYDIQIFVKNEDANYNMIGYKNKNNEEITWVSDAIVSEEEVNEEK